VSKNESRIDAGLPILNSFEHVAREWLASIAHTVRDITHQNQNSVVKLAASRKPNRYRQIQPVFSQTHPRATLHAQKSEQRPGLI
jgi:hypothetical protein